MPLGAVLFDLDGTLVDSERDNVESVVLAVARLGRTLDEEDRRFIIGHSWNEIHARICARHGLDVPMDELIAAAVDEKRALVSRSGLRVLPGARALVERLAARVPLAIVTGSSRVEARDAVEAMGLRDQFRLLVAAEDYARGKPDPEPYAMAANRLEVHPSACLVFEDATPGILSARAAGATVIGVRAGNFAGYDLSPAHAVFDTLEDASDARLAALLP